MDNIGEHMGITDPYVIVTIRRLLVSVALPNQQDDALHFAEELDRLIGTGVRPMARRAEAEGRTHYEWLGVPTPVE